MAYRKPKQSPGYKRNEQSALARQIQADLQKLGMTQKELGVAVGFPESSADVRIAQYESGARTPKRELLCQLAAPLGVSPSQFTVPRIKNSEELCSLLAALEDECGIELSPRSENAKAIYQSYWKGATDIENL